MTARLIRIDWPDFGQPGLPPALSLPELDGRLARVRAASARAGYAALVVYGDREHAANLHWLTGFDPRFEEAVLVITAEAALLLAGNECLPYTGISPPVASGAIRVGHCSSLSLPSQPREGRNLRSWLDECLPQGAAIGVVGWKWFEAGEVPDPAIALDVPAFLADPLRDIGGRVENATTLMMHPAHGLRTRVDAAEIARLEFSNHMAASAMRRMAFAFREGMSDFEAFQSGLIGGLPLACHSTFATGRRAAQGLSGPTGEVLELGQPLSFNVSHWGSNICRAGWLARTAADLPADAARYLEDFAFPYVAAMSKWCSMMQPGVAGSAVWQAMYQALPSEVFGMTLNPGHLIGLDEWLSSPITEGSDIPLASGMAMQMDVIPTNPVFGSTRMEDGYVIADAELRADLANSDPLLAARVAARQTFMRDVIGMDLPESLLPLADTCGVVAPFLLDPGLVIAL